MAEKITIRIPVPNTQDAEVHSFVDLDNARDFLTDRIRAERKAKQVEPKVNDVPGE